MLDQPYMTDLIEANSMGHEPNLIDIYSASWGPTDDGRTVDGPRNATMRAIVRGVNEVSKKGRPFFKKSKCATYVFPSLKNGQQLRFFQSYKKGLQRNRHSESVCREALTKGNKATFCCSLFLKEFLKPWFGHRIRFELTSYMGKA